MKRFCYLSLIGILAGIFLMTVGTGNTFAQATASGTLQGTVSDSSGAAVSELKSLPKVKQPTPFER